MYPQHGCDKLIKVLLVLAEFSWRTSVRVVNEGSVHVKSDLAFITMFRKLLPYFGFISMRFSFDIRNPQKDRP
jgi:hypothetical protein